MDNQKEVILNIACVHEQVQGGKCPLQFMCPHKQWKYHGMLFFPEIPTVDCTKKRKEHPETDKKDLEYEGNYEKIVAALKYHRDTKKFLDEHIEKQDILTDTLDKTVADQKQQIDELKKTVIELEDTINELNVANALLPVQFSEMEKILRLQCDEKIKIATEKLSSTPECVICMNHPAIWAFIHLDPKTFKPQGGAHLCYCQGCYEMRWALEVESNAKTFWECPMCRKPDCSVAKIFY